MSQEFICLSVCAYIVHIGVRHRESRDSSSGNNGVAHTGIEGATQDLKRPIDDGRECAEGILLWVGLYVLENGSAWDEPGQLDG